jgi:hypothetical protein
MSDPEFTNNPVRRKQVLRTVLTTLKFASPYALPAEAMWENVNDLLSPPLRWGERGPVITQLKNQKLVTQVEDSLDKELIQYALTELGRTYLQTL